MATERVTSISVTAHCMNDVHRSCNMCHCRGCQNCKHPAPKESNIISPINTGQQIMTDLNSPEIQETCLSSSREVAYLRFTLDITKSLIPLLFTKFVFTELKKNSNCLAVRHNLLKNQNTA